MCTRNTAVAVQNVDPLGKRVFLGSPRSYTLFVGTGYLEKSPDLLSDGVSDIKKTGRRGTSNAPGGNKKFL